MTRQARLARLVDLVVENGSIHVDEVVEKLGISPATARRDLDSLAEQQLVIRTRGGARSNPSTGEVPLRQRGARQWREKGRIAARAIELVRPGDVVGFNGGTTTTATAHELGIRVSAEADFENSPVTVVTNAVNIANDLTIRPQLRVVVTGGVARTRSFELIGPLAALILPSLQIDLLFLGVNSIDLTTGALCADDQDEAAINAALVQASSRVVVLADSSKLGRSAFARIGTLQSGMTVITDDAADQNHLAALRERGVEVLVA